MNLFQALEEKRQQELKASPYKYETVGRASQVVNNLLDYLTSAQRTQQLQGLGGILEATGIPKTLERIAYGEPLTTGSGFTTQLKPETQEALLTVMPIPAVSKPAAQAAERGAMALGRAGERYAERVVPELYAKGGLTREMLEALGTGTQSMAIPKPTTGLLGSVDSSLNYRGSHTAPGPDFGAPLHDLTGGGQMYPADVYSAKAVQYYGTGYPKADKEAFDLAKRVKGNPDAEVTMYRAVPNDKSITNINEGDWVTLSKDYAETHGESALQGNYKIISKKVKAKELYTNADSIHEFGYWPQ